MILEINISIKNTIGDKIDKKIYIKGNDLSISNIFGIIERGGDKSNSFEFNEELRKIIESKSVIIKPNIKIHGNKRGTILKKELSIDKRFYRYTIKLENGCVAIFLDSDFNFII